MAATAADVDEIRKKRSVVRKKRKKMRSAVGAKISKLEHEGKPHDQAVAMALDMKRRGRLGPRGGYRRKGR